MSCNVPASSSSASRIVLGFGFAIVSGPLSCQVVGEGRPQPLSLSWAGSGAGPLDARKM